LGLATVALGVISSYNLFVAGPERIGWSWWGVRSLLFFGPLLVSVGLLLLWGTRRSHTWPDADGGAKSRAVEAAPLAAGNLAPSPALARTGPPSHRHQPALLWLGTLLLLPPIALFVFLVLSESEIVGLIFTLSLVVFGLPGIAVLAVGIWQGIRRNRVGGARGGLTKQ
jgi:hypothetical protein